MKTDCPIKETQLGYLAGFPFRIRRLSRYSMLPLWYVFKLKHLRCLRTDPGVLSDEQVRKTLDQKEENVRAILSSGEIKSFLEIGIGELPNIERLRLMLANNVRYTGCDFTSVCDDHKRVLELSGVYDTRSIRFRSNSVGSYSWTLFEFLQRGEKFDLIYLDGHHTFYVDLPAIILADYLLKCGGYFLVDDITWTLELMRKIMFRYFRLWYFYRTTYDFSQYETSQQRIPHIQMMVEEFLIKRLGYCRLEQYSSDLWWALKKGQVAS